MNKITLLFFLLASFVFNAQIIESFEGSFPPAGWVAFPGQSGASFTEWEQQDDVYSGTIGWAHTGEFATVSSFDYEGLTEGWLVTPQYTPTADEHTLYFHQRQLSSEDYSSEYTIRVSTATQTTHADFTIIDTQDETEVPMVYGLHTVDLSAYIGTPIFLAFVHAQDDDDEWYIDDVLTVEVEVPGATTNPVPANGATEIAITNSQTSVVDLSWVEPTTGGDALQYDLFVGSTIDNLRLLGRPENFEAHPSTFHFNTTYYWKAAAVNMGGESSDTWSFTTVEQPTINAPYNIDFENAGFVPDACDQAVMNIKWWEYANALSGHIGNNGNAEGTATESGGYFAFIDDSDNPNSLNSTFLTPFIDFSGISQPAFSFYMISNGEGEGNVTFSIKAGNDAIGWTTVFTSETDTAGWEKKVVELNAVDTSNPIQLQFIVDEIADTTKDDFAIDDIKFDTLYELSTNDFTISGLSYSPNPTQDIFTIQADEIIETVAIYNLLGQQVFTQLINSETIEINTNDLVAGSYIVKITTSNKQNSFKIIKE